MSTAAARAEEIRGRLVYYAQNLALGLPVSFDDINGIACEMGHVVSEFRELVEAAQEVVWHDDSPHVDDLRAALSKLK